MRRRYSCADGFCGAEDCTTCRGAGADDPRVECGRCGDKFEEDNLNKNGLCEDCAILCSECGETISESRLMRRLTMCNSCGEEI